ncbi:MAG: hypothetical protein SP4CHLAM5_10300 [Chlamydiia bacterium]|nr:hypothetical protein [Chlamydiia bacterium]MCH9618887.1 hypothetical protein [Chlamydiia bacterium]MCH9624554.1 hypothetical protein [Chlamydiia bacterium]
MSNPIRSSHIDSNLNTQTSIKSKLTTTLKSQAKAIKLIIAVGAAALTILGVVSAILIPVSIPFVAAALIATGAVVATSLNLNHILETLTKGKAQTKVNTALSTSQPKVVDEITRLSVSKDKEEAAPILTDDSPLELKDRAYLKQCDEKINEHRKTLNKYQNLLDNIKTNHLDRQQLEEKILTAQSKIDKAFKEKARVLEERQTSENSIT